MQWVFPISPVAASRPRVSKWGSYYTGPYKTFRQDVQPVIVDVLGEWTPMSGPIEVDIGVYPTKPRTSKLDYPRPDVDNYVKSVLDSCNGIVWLDDSQIVKIVARKEWAEQGYFTMEVNEL